MSASTTTAHQRGVQERGFWRGVSRGVTSVLLIVVLALAGALAVVPRVMGGEAPTVLTGARQRTYSAGDGVVGVPPAEHRAGGGGTFPPAAGDATPAA